MNDINLYKEEVKELTELLHTEWTDIQNILRDKNLNVVKTFLLGFFESEEGVAFGLFYTENNELLYFEQSDEYNKTEIVSKDDIKNEFPQVCVLDDIDNFINW